MARQARRVSPTGYYHIMMRGNNKERIFEKESDKNSLIESLKKAKEEDSIKIVAYCFMDNHIHLVIKSELSDLSMAIKKINIKYAMIFNKKNGRVGHVFQDRYKSEVVASDQYLLQVIRYVHKNPVKAKIISSVDSYRWSSYNEYKNAKYNVVNKEEGNFIMGYFSGNRGLFQKFHDDSDYTVFLDTKEEMEEQKLDIAQRLISDFFVARGINNSIQFKRNQDYQVELIKVLLDKSQLSHKKIAGLLELNINVVHQASLKRG